MKRFLLILSLVASGTLYSQNTNPPEKPGIKASPKKIAANNDIAINSDLCQTLGLDANTATTESVSKALIELKTSDVEKYMELRAKYFNNGNQLKKQIKRSEYEKLTEERKNHITNHPDEYIIID